MNNFVNNFGGKDAIPQVQELTEADIFENAIRRFGVIAACEWFGHRPDSSFTEETIHELIKRATK